MSAYVHTCANETGSPSMSRTEDNLSNSDGPLLKRTIYRNNNNSLRHSHTISDSPQSFSDTRKRYCFWTLTSILAIVGLCNLFLSITVIAILRVSSGMEALEVIPDENLVKFYGDTDLDQICVQSGVCQGYGDEPMRISGGDEGIRINVKNRRPHDRQRPYVEVVPTGTSITQVESFEIKDPQTDANYFSTDFPNFGLPDGVKEINVKITKTHRIVSPVNNTLSVKSDRQISMHGAEGAKMESKEIIWTANNDIFLKSINGNIVLDIKDGLFLNVHEIPIVQTFLPDRSTPGQYKVCICMPQGRLFRVPVPSGSSARGVNCANFRTSPENDHPCL